MRVIIIEILNNSMLANLLIWVALVVSVHSQSCLATYEYSDPNSAACLPCPTSCSSCFDTQSCTACVPEYYLSNNLCLRCPFGCSVCTSGSTCSLCIDGLYVNADGECVACANGVQSCTIAAIQTCKDGYFMLDTICAGCLDHCTKCQDFVTCLLCDGGYFLGPNSTSCQPCSSNCAVCQDATTCTSCSRGFVLSGGSCINPACSSISPFCQKCSNGLCEECQFGKYVNSNGSCSQGASLLCLSASGLSHTNCQTNLYGCPSYANVETDTSSSTQLPVCIPKLASQTSEYFYSSLRSLAAPTQCNASSSSACSAPSSQQIPLQLVRPYFHLQYTIALRIYSTATQNVVVSALQTSTNSSLGMFMHSVNITAELAQGLSDANCFNCPYGHTIIAGELSGAGNTNGTIIEVDSSSSLVVVEEIQVKADVCKVERCAACSTAIDCVQCNTPYYLQLISCVEACDPGFYKYNRACVLACPSNTYPIQSSYECSPCVAPCQTCSAANLCLSCVAGYFLQQSSCVQACSRPELFTNLTSQQCELCPNPCTQCTVTIVNSSSPTGWSVSCSGCGVGYLLQGGNCTYICPLGTFSNYAGNKTQCSTCASGCNSCSISQILCSSCQGSYLLDGSTCLLNYACPLGYFTNFIKNSCQKCHYPCSTCSLAATNCTSCAKGALLNNSCPLECPPAMFVDYSNNSQVCTPCISPCVQCLNLNICLSCVAGSFLYDGQCQPHCPMLTLYEEPSNGTCLPCQPPCMECQNSTYCLSCTTGYLNPITHTCTLECAPAWYPDSNFNCQPCLAPCLRCYSNSSCSMCQLPSVLYNQACISVAQCSTLDRYVHYHLNYSSLLLVNESAECSQCTYPCSSCSTSPILCSACAPTYLIVPDLSICLQVCPQSYFPNTTAPVPVCQKCESQCLACSQTASNCTQCGTSLYLNSAAGTCSQNCPSGYYGSNEEQLCKPCQSPCLECYNVYLCRSCVTGIFYNKACVSSCPDGSIHNTTANLCDACTNNCLSCSVSTSNCTQCPTNGFYFFQNQCVTQCPTGFYADQMSHACQPCIAPCNQCLSSSTCVTCVPSYFLVPNSGHCSTTCPDGSFADLSTSRCETCNTTICSTCLGSANNCTKCMPGYYFDGALLVCAQNCPAGTYADSFYLECRTCRFPCIVCTADVCSQCDPAYKLYGGNCYSNCPIGYFPTTLSTCGQCDPLCEICTNFTTCLSCQAGYFVNASSACVPRCEIGYYGGADPLTSYAQCFQCPSECIQCTETFNCTSCRPGYFYFNGLCETECPALYFALNGSSGPTCSPCPQYCNKCTSSLTCLECLNSYIYESQCFASCPKHTYTFNEEQCIDCVTPCLECTSPYYCLSCSAEYLFFQNYCVQQCPEDVWKYPDTRECRSECPYNKYVAAMQCYVTGCGGMLVHLNGYCLQQCPADYYVDENQNCIVCSQNSKECSSNLFAGQLTILRTHNLKACLYFNQLIQVDLIDTSRIQLTFTDESTSSQIQYDQSSVAVAESSITIQFGYRQMELSTILVKIPYIRSKSRSQSISYNQFRQSIDVYNNYQYEPSYIKTGSTSTGQTTSQTQINALYAPIKALSVIGIALISGCFICLLLNIVSKGAHYRQLLDFLQFVAVTLYLEIQYPPAMASFLESIQISMFSFLPDLSIPLPYAFSSSKFIENNGDSSMLRSQGVLFIVFAVLFLTFMVLMVVNKLKPDLLVIVIKRVKYRNVTDLFCITSLPLLLFAFNFKGSNIADIAARVAVLTLTAAFLGYMSYVLMTVKNLEQIAGLAGELEATESPLGHMYTPFAFLRKIIFALLINIQPQKPISSLTLLLIFTILIMVCLFFYQPFENQITDYVSIFMEVMLILFVLVLMLFGLNAVKATSGHYLAIVGCTFVIIGAVGGLAWLGYLTILQIKKFKDEKQTQTVKNDLEERIQSQNQPEDMRAGELGPISGSKISSKDMKQSDQVNQNKEEDQPSAANLIRNSQIKPSPAASNIKDGPRLGDEQVVSDLNESNEENNEEFRHWNNDESSSQQSSKVKQRKAPRYLLKMEKNRNA